MKKTYISICLLLLSLNLNAGVKIAVFNDLNGYLGNPKYNNGVLRGIKNLIKENPDIAIAPGDIISGEDPKKKFSDNDFKKMWDSFNKNIHTKLQDAKIPFAPSPGNHDANTSYPREVRFYGEYFKKSENYSKIDFVDQRNYPYYYSFKVGNVFFISLNDTKSWRLSKDPINEVTQKMWIKAQLATPEALSSSARIVYGHIPLYSVINKYKHSSKFKSVLSAEQYSKTNPNTLEQILVEGDTTLAIFAHSHAFYPGVVKQTALKSGLNMLFSPCLGPGHRYLAGNSSKRSEEGYSIINVEENGDVSYSVYTTDGKVMDTSNLPKKIISNNKVVINRDDTLFLGTHKSHQDSH